MAEQSYLALWHTGAGTQWWVTGLNFDQFKAQDKTYFDQGLRLVSLRVHAGVYTAVWHPGTGTQWWASGLTFDQFKAQDKTYFDQGLRLVDIEIQNGVYTGVWRPGSGTQWWAGGLSFDAFKAQDKTYFDQGLRLVCLRVLNDGTYAGVWHPGTGTQWWASGLNYNDFKAQDKAYFDQGLRLVDIELHNGSFTGVWRPGTGTQWWYFGNDFEMLVGRDRAFFDQGLRLVKVFPYPGSCDISCLNQVVMPTSTYNYGITRTAQHCPGLPGTCGSPAAGDVVYYRWPCYTFDGSVRVARISALTFSEPQLFTLPFSDHAVNELGPWLYSPGSWHHAIDFQRSDKASFNVLAAAPGQVIFSGWDWWSGNTIVISHDSGRAKDVFRTIYMHLRNDPNHDADQAWNVTVPNLSEPGKTQYKNYLNSTGCPQTGNRNPKAQFWGTDADKIDPNIVGKHVNAGDLIGHSGCTGPGGCGCTNSSASWTWGGGVNTHLHIFFARRDPTDHEWYFIDPYGIYASGACYPALNTPITTPCARYPVLWKGSKAQYP